VARSKAKSKKKSKRDLPPAYEWLRDLKKTNSPIYLLHGEESIFSHEAAEWLHNRALGHGIPDFNLDRFDASESQFSVAALLNAVDTQPMMNPIRVVWVQATELLNKQAKAHLEGLIKYCETPNPQTCLILEARDRLDQSRALMKALAKSENVTIREAGVMSAHQTEKWLESQTKILGITTSQQVLTLIQESGEGRLGEMSDTLSKLMLYIQPRIEITIDDVTEVLPQAKLQTTVWVLLDKLALRQTVDVISLAHSLLNQGQEVLGLVALVHRRLRELLAAKSVMQMGGGEALLAQSLKMNGYAAKRIIQLAQDRRSMNAAQLANGYLLLAQADRMFKGAKVDQKILLEHILLKLCTS
jgi:DNA polymerase III subunit delta